MKHFRSPESGLVLCGSDEPSQCVTSVVANVRCPRCLELIHAATAMTKEQLWEKYVTENTRLADDEFRVLITAATLKKVVMDVWSEANGDKISGEIAMRIMVSGMWKSLAIELANNSPESSSYALMVVNTFTEMADSTQAEIAAESFRLDLVANNII